MDNADMISNFFTILHVARYLTTACRDARVCEIYTQDRRRLSITLAGTSVTTIIISCLPGENAVYTVDGAHRARQNAIDLFPEFWGKTLSYVACDGRDRVLSIQFTDGCEMRAEFFGVKANIIAYTSDGRPTRCFLGGRETTETRPIAAHLSELPLNAETLVGTLFEFTTRFQNSEKSSTLAALRTAVPTLGTTVAEELLFETQISPNASVDSLTGELFQRLHVSALHRVIDLLDCSSQRKSRIYWDDRRPVCFSIFSLQSASMFREEVYANCSEGIRRFIGASHARHEFDREKHSLRSWMQKDLARCERTLEKMDSEAGMHDRSGEYKNFGALLMMHLGEMTKGMQCIVLNDFLTDTPVSITLDPALTPAQNAERYFVKAKHAKAAKNESIGRRTSLTGRTTVLRPLLTELDAVCTRDELKSFRARSNGLMKSLGYMTDTERELLPPFRIFTVDGGFQVLAGKSSDNNDLLTMRYAKPNDLWFHARGSSGSHVVLKIATGNGTPSKKAIQQTASIAAYYSKMKNASAVPVAMTEKKYVHKPRGVPAGTVTLDREKIIFAEPKLPDDLHLS